MEQEKKNNAPRELSFVDCVRSRLLLGPEAYSPYPYEKEKLLVHAIRSGDISEARRLLNELLGFIFFASADNLDSIKIRAFELTVLMSRAALDGGADAASIYQMSPAYLSRFFAMDNIDDICDALSEILKRFSEETFGVFETKHAAVISASVSYIRNNYMHKITLDDVAAHVFLSPSYLSRIFRDEMHTNFNTFLSEVRVEKSKILLLSHDLSIVEIASLVGFGDQSYFNKIFKKITGVTPKTYREHSGE